MKRLLGLLVRYAVAGGLAAVVDVGLFWLFAETLRISVEVAAVGSFLVACAVNFAVSSTFVYKSKLLDAKRAFAFFVFAVIGLMVNAGVTVMVAHLTTIPVVLAKVCGIGVAFLINFLLNTFIVFKPVKAG